MLLGNVTWRSTNMLIQNMSLKYLLTTDFICLEKTGLKTLTEP